MCIEMPNLRRIYLETLFWMWAVAKNWDRREKRRRSPPLWTFVCHIQRLSPLCSGEKKQNRYGNDSDLNVNAFSKGPLLKMFSVSSMFTSNLYIILWKERCAWIARLMPRSQLHPHTDLIFFLPPDIQMQFKSAVHGSTCLMKSIMITCIRQSLFDTHGHNTACSIIWNGPVAKLWSP